MYLCFISQFYRAPIKFNLIDQNLQEYIVYSVQVKKEPLFGSSPIPK